MAIDTVATCRYIFGTSALHTMTQQSLRSIVSWLQSKSAQRSEQWQAAMHNRR